MWLSRELGSGPSTNVDMDGLPCAWGQLLQSGSGKLASPPSDRSRLPCLGPLLHVCLRQGPQAFSTMTEGIE